MAIMHRLSASSMASSPRVAMVATRSATRRPCVLVSASSTTPEVTVSRRQAMGVAASIAAAVLSSASPSLAFLGIGEDDIQAKYAEQTGAILTKVKTILALDRDDPTKDDQIKALRSDINSWVATYRREERVSGRPSYGNTYSALNAVAGHYNNFGTQAPIPKKRLDRILKELDDAALFASRGR